MRNQWSIIVAGIVGAAGLVAPIGVAAADAAAAGRPAPAVKSVTRSYGDKPVRLASKRQQLELSFTGRRGDRVDLIDPDYFPGTICGRVTLIRDGKKITRHTLEHWRLPRSARYTFRFAPRTKPCTEARRPGRLQLTKVELVKPATDPVSLPRKRGVVYAVQARVPSSGMVNVANSPGDPGFVALVSQGRTAHFGLATSAGQSAGLPRVTERSQLLLRPDAAPLGFMPETIRIPNSEPAPLTAHAVTDPLPAGQRIALLHLGGASVGAWTPTQHHTTYDGAAVPVTTSAAAFGQPQVLTFEGTAGSFLHPQDGTGNHGASYASALIGPDGFEPPYRPNAPIQLTRTGTHSLVFLPSVQAVGTPAGLRAAGVTMLPAMQTDGPATRFAAPEPGRLVMAPTTQLAHLTIAATHPGGPTFAYGVTAPEHRPDCSKSTANGCGDTNSVVVSTAGSQGGTAFGPGWVYVAFTRSHTGPIDLSMVSKLPVTG